MYTCLCLSQARTEFSTPYVVVSSVYNGLRREVVSGFLYNICGCVDHHCLDLLFIMLYEITNMVNKSKTRRETEKTLNIFCGEFTPAIMKLEAMQDYLFYIN